MQPAAALRERESTPSPTREPTTVAEFNAALDAAALQLGVTEYNARRLQVEKDAWVQRIDDLRARRDALERALAGAAAAAPKRPAS